MKKQTRVTHPKEVKLLDGNDSVVRPVYRSVKFTYPTIAASLTPEAKEHGFTASTTRAIRTRRRVSSSCSRPSFRIATTRSPWAAAWLRSGSRCSATSRPEIAS
jgi:hypothetical protein